jgi:hypothetical protein
VPRLKKQKKKLAIVGTHSVFIQQAAGGQELAPNSAELVAGGFREERISSSWALQEVQRWQAGTGREILEPSSRHPLGENFAF